MFSETSGRVMTPEMVMLLRVLLYVMSRSGFLAPGRDVWRM